MNRASAHPAIPPAVPRVSITCGGWDVPHSDSVTTRGLVSPCDENISSRRSPQFFPKGIRPHFSLVSEFCAACLSGAYRSAPMRHVRQTLIRKGAAP